MKKRAFSLLEIILVVVLMVIVAAVVIVNGRQGAPRGQISGVADLVAEELRSARFRAISQQTPVAVVFPSNGGSTAVSSGLYVLEGAVHPKVVRSIRYDREYPDSRIFVGVWPGLSSPNRDDLRIGSPNSAANIFWFFSAVLATPTAD